MSLELAREPRRGRSQAPAETPANPADWYPKPKADHRWLFEGLKRLLLLVGIVVALGAAWRVVRGDAVPAPLAALVRALKGESGGTREAGGDGQGVDCFTDTEGEYIVYTDDAGTENIVESPAAVPPKYRARARCVFMKR